MTALTPESVVQFDLTQCHAEAAARWKKAAEIDARYPKGLTIDDNAEDFNECKRLRGELDLIETRSAKLEEAGQWTQRVKANAEKYGRPIQRHTQPEGDAGDGPMSDTIEMFGHQFVKSDDYKRIVDSGILHNPSSRVELNIQLKGSLLAFLARKALVYSGTGVGGNSLIQNDRVPGLDFLTRQLTFLDLIPTARTTSNMIEYYEMTSSTNNAAAVAEASVTTGATGLKPEGAIGWALRTSPVATIAEWIPVTNQMLADAPGVEGMIREQLLSHLDLKLETDLITGNGTPPNLTGVLNTANIQTLGLAAGATYGGQASVVDAAYAAMIQVMVTGLAAPSAYVFNPVDFAAVRLARENAASGTLGAYMYGPPSVSGPATLWGLPVVQSIGLTENTMLVADWQRATMLFDREQAAIRVGTINDQFTRNMQTILAELRAAFVVFRPTAIARVTGV